MMRLICFVFILLIIGCRNDPKDVDRIFGQRLLPQEVAKNITIEYRDSTRLKVVVKAPKLERKKIENQEVNVFDEGVFVQFYDRRNRPESWLTADWARQNIRTSEVVLRENVILYNIQGDTLITSEMIWNEPKEEMYTTKFVKIKRPKQEVLYSYGFKADQNFTTFTVNAIEGDLEFDELKTDF